MYNRRMPQPGEYWRLWRRENLEAPPQNNPCGHKKQGPSKAQLRKYYYGQAFMVVPIMARFQCWTCRRTFPISESDVAIRVPDWRLKHKGYFVQVIVPYNVLEPVDWWRTHQQMVSGAEAQGADAGRNAERGEDYGVVKPRGEMEWCGAEEWDESQWSRGMKCGALEPRHGVR